MFHKIALASRVYIKSLLFVGLLLTTAFVFIIYSGAAAEGGSLPMLVLGRIFVFAPILYVFHEFKKKEFIYYRNLGLSRLRLLASLWLLDAALSIIILATSYAIIK